MLDAKRGFTLIELIIAISLVGLIILAIVGVDVASRRFVNTSDYEARAQNQIGPVLEMIVKDVSRAVGNVRFDSGVNQTTASDIRARIDRNNSPSNYGDDTWVGYRYISGTIQRTECSPNWPCAASWETIANNLINTPPTNITSFTITPDGSVGIVISAQLPESDNTTVTMETSVFPLGNSAN